MRAHFANAAYGVLDYAAYGSVSLLLYLPLLQSVRPGCKMATTSGLAATLCESQAETEP
jgi:hypothetical protein